MNQETDYRQAGTPAEVFELQLEEIAHVAGGPEVGNEPPPR